MWFTGDAFTAGNIGYAESVDGITGWTKYGSNPVLTGHFRGNVVHDGSTFYQFAANYSTNQIDLYTSPDTDGLTWTLNTANIIAKGSSGQFDQSGIENSTVINDGGTWKMFYEGRTGPYASAVYTCGAATASSPSGPWTKVNYSGNPLISGPGCSGPWLAKVGSNYWLWSTVADVTVGMARWTATALGGPWTLNPDRTTYYNGSTFQPASSDEWPIPGALADQWQIEVGGSTYRYYAATNDGSQATGHSHIKLTIAPFTLSGLVGTIEGMTSKTP